MTRLTDVLDGKTIDDIFKFAKEVKKNYFRKSYSQIILDLERVEVMKIIVNNIPKSVVFDGQDLIDYMYYLTILLENTNFTSRYTTYANRK